MTIIKLLILLVIYTITATHVEAQSMPSASAPTAIGGVDRTFSENNGIRILGIDSTAFPKIKVNLYMDRFCALSGNFRKEDFMVMEDDNDTAVDNLHFTGNASGQKLDLGIVFDETTSMEEEINALKSKVKDLTYKINSSKLDARYSLVTFNGADVTTRINWTSDAESFRNIIGKLSLSGGNTELPENSLEGIERALSLGFRPDAQKVIIVVTDEPSRQKGDGKSNSSYTKDDVKSDLLKTNAMLIAVSPDFRNRNVNPGFQLSNLPKYVDMRELANEARSLWIDMDSADFSTILKQIQGIITGIYVIDYTSSDLTPAENRTVFLSVDAPGCLEGSASGNYTTPGRLPAINVPPVITSLTSDKPSPQEAGTVILWTANASDADGDQVLLKFFLNGLPSTNWQLSNQWPWAATEGEFRIEVQVRDGKHAGPNEMDDRMSKIFKINTPTMPAIIIEKSHTDSWQKTLGGLLDDIGAAVQQTSDGGYIMAGHTSSYGAGGMDLWMIRTNAAGNEIWSRTFGGMGDDFITSVQQTSDDGYIVVGITSSYGAGGKDLWMIKTDAQGYKQWDKTFGGLLDDGGISVQQTRDGGYIATGATGSIGPSGVWLVKTDPPGSLLWDKTLDIEGDVGQMSAGSSVQQTSDGGYIVAGDSSKQSVLLIKTDARGNKQWGRIFGGLATDSKNVNANTRARQTSDGGYIIVSYTSSYGAGGMDLWMIKTDATGNEIWSKTFGGVGDDFGTTVQQTSDGGYIMTGHTSSYGAGGMDLWMVKTDALGNESWSKTFGGVGDDFGTSVQQTSDGGYIMTGYTSSYGAGGMDLWMIKTDASGNVEG